jgi:hypothetical protein
MTNDWALDPLPILQNARQQFVDVGALDAQLSTAAPDVTTTTTATPETFEAAMSSALKDAVEDYRAADGGRQLRLLRYTRATNGEVQVIVDAGEAPPGEDELVQITVSVSVADADRLLVVAEVLVGARTAA